MESPYLSKKKRTKIMKVNLKLKIWGMKMMKKVKMIQIIQNWKNK